ncbi:class I SAM-dependent methyltransferase [Actinoplanes sp. NPDC051411]|uniref:SAM-dependent methyltransferase n=1 Tax=Actinoplanes sp. NPDC051411 TaxID=3155522 RepID=UPI003419C89C
MDTNQIKEWSAGAQAVSLLGAAHEHGWIDFLAESRDVAALAGFSGLPVERTRAVLEALAGIGVVESKDNEFRLAPAYAATMSPDAPFSMGDLLAEARMMRRVVAQAVEGPLPAPDESDALVVADAYGLRPTQTAIGLFGQLLEALPEFAGLLPNGRYIDVGCGVAGFLLTCARTYPTMRGVGVELVAPVAAEAERRAKELGVSDRVEIRCMDARDLPDEDAFDSAFWAQPFFPEPVRADTLAAIFRALKPGAPLAMQEMERQPDDPAERAAFALRELVFTGWGVPFARSAEALTAEATDAGFVLDRMGDTPFGRLVIVRKPS